MVAALRHDPQRQRPSQHVEPARDRHHRLVEQHEGRARIAADRPSPFRCRPARAAAATIHRCPRRPVRHWRTGSPRRRRPAAAAPRDWRRRTALRRRPRRARRHRAAPETCWRHRTAPSGPRGNGSSVSPMIAGAAATAARSNDAPSSERQIATGPGQGSAKTAARVSTTGSSRVEQRQIEQPHLDRPDRRRHRGRRDDRGAPAAH